SLSEFVGVEKTTKLNPETSNSHPLRYPPNYALRRGHVLFVYPMMSPLSGSICIKVRNAT
ncbi:hypothetical protein AB4175_23960, partial [Vibrio cyclitrophicus]